MKKLVQSTFRASFTVTLAICALLIAAMAYRLAAPRPGPQPAAQCFDLFEGLCQWLATDCTPRPWLMPRAAEGHSASTLAELG